MPPSQHNGAIRCGGLKSPGDCLSNTAILSTPENETLRRMRVMSRSKVHIVIKHFYVNALRFQVVIVAFTGDRRRWLRLCLVQGKPKYSK